MDQTQLYQSTQRILSIAGVNHSFAGGVWGSLSRLELTPFSDVDVFCYSREQGTPPSFTDVQQTLQALAKDHPVDVLHCTRDNIVDTFALRNGINFHAIYFLPQIVGDPIAASSIIKAQIRLHASEQLRARELINVLGSHRNLSRGVICGDPKWAKFSVAGTNCWVRLAQAAQLRYPQLVGSNTRAILLRLAEMYGANPKGVANDWAESMRWRVGYEENILNNRSLTNNAPIYPYWKPLATAFLLDSFSWVQRVAGAPQWALSMFAREYVGVDLVIIEPEQIDENLSSTLSAIVLSEPEKLESLARHRPGHWWVATALAANPSTPPEVLDWLVFPDFDLDINVWRTVFLYVAKNQNTSTQTLQRLLETPQLRQQDYEAAAFNLSKRVSTEDD